MIARVLELLLSLLGLFRSFQKTPEEKVDAAKAKIDESIARADRTGRP